MMTAKGTWESGGVFDADLGTQRFATLGCGTEHEGLAVVMQGQFAVAQALQRRQEARTQEAGEATMRFCGIGVVAIDRVCRAVHGAALDFPG